MKLTVYGIREWLGSGICALALLAGCAGITFYSDPFVGICLASLTILLWLLLAMFFRDPFRKIPPAPDILVAPADGTVKDMELITETDENDYFDGRNTLRIGIFLSVLNVHLNRVPCDVEIQDKFSRTGQFHDARDPRASRENEAVTLVCKSTGMPKTFPLLIRQISGAIAKRIVCVAEKGSKLKKGDCYGMIKFGSRTELFLPACPEIEILVKVGDKVYAGETPVARLKDETWETDVESK